MSTVVRLNAIEAVAHIGAGSQRFRYLLLSTGFLNKLASWVHEKTEPKALRLILRTLSILSGETHTETLPFKRRVSILPAMCVVLLNSKDPEVSREGETAAHLRFGFELSSCPISCVSQVLVHTLTCLAYLLPGVHVNNNAEAFYKRLCALASAEVGWP